MKFFISALTATIALALYLLVVVGVHWCCGKSELDAWILLCCLIGYVWIDFYQIASKHTSELLKERQTK